MMTINLAREQRLMAAITALARIRLVSQQVWLAQLPYLNVEHRCIVFDAHEHLSEDARAMIGLILSYPDTVQRELNQTPNGIDGGDYRPRTSNTRRAYGRGRTINYIRKERKVNAQYAKRVYYELKDFIQLLGAHTRSRDYDTVSIWGMMEHAA